MKTSASTTSNAVQGVLCFVSVISFRPFTIRWKHGQKCIEQIVKDFSLSAFSENNELLFMVNAMHPSTSIPGK